MQELNNIKIIAVDHETANTVTPTRVIDYKNEPIFSGNILDDIRATAKVYEYLAFISLRRKKQAMNENIRSTNLRLPC